MCASRQYFLPVMVALWLPHEAAACSKSHAPPHGFPCSSLRCFSRACTGQASSRETEHRSGSSVPLRAVPIVGIRYGELPGPAGLADMPAAARALVTDRIRAFQRTDRGMVRARGDKTMDTRATWFRDLLESIAGYSDLACASLITPQQAVLLLSAYLAFKASTPLPGTDHPPAADTLNHYLTAAATFLAGIVTTPFSIYDDTNKKVKSLKPLLGDIITQRRKWQAPKQKREPYTYV